MLSIEQQRKAKEALEKQKAKDKEKRKALIWHLSAFSDLHYNGVLLPYRVLYDLHRSEHEGTFKEIFPNPFYPNPGISSKLALGKPSYRGETDKLPTKSVILDSQEIEMPDYMADPDYRKQLEEYERKVQAEKMDTEKWGYWYARFLLPYDLRSFSDFDWLGEVPRSEEEKTFLKHFKSACIEAQADCTTHQERYNMKPIERKQEHREVYDTPYNYI